MYLYLITNMINNKKYIGITNNPKKRWENHKCNNDKTMAIAKAINKYGKENFKFEVLLSGIPIEKIDEYEIEYIKRYESHVSTGKGYNISKGGRYNISNSIHKGEENGRALLTDKEVQYIKNHRNEPMYLLYDDFSEKISYSQFKKIYNNKVWLHIQPTVECYPYNTEFSAQFVSSKISYEEVIKLREQYEHKIPWREAYTNYYKKIYPNELAFWNIYVGNRFKFVKPEVFNEDNKHFQASISHSGENNGRSKLTKMDIIKMRKEFESKEKTRKEIQQEYADIVSPSIINRILAYKSWTNIV